jgi:hypothetical protein
MRKKCGVDRKFGGESIYLSGSAHRKPVCIIVEDKNIN